MKHPITALIFLGLCSTSAAEGFNYNYVSASYVTVDFDDLNIDGDGFGLGLSLSISDEFHLFGGYQGTNFDLGVDGSAWSVGAGFHTPISDVIDVVATVSYEFVEVDVRGLGSIDDDGFGLGIGLRAAVSDRVEIDAGIGYADLNDRGDNTAFSAGFLFNVTDTISLGLSGIWDDDATAYSFRGRVYFGN